MRAQIEAALAVSLCVSMNGAGSAPGTPSALLGCSRGWFVSPGQ